MILNTVYQILNTSYQTISKQHRKKRKKVQRQIKINYFTEHQKAIPQAALEIQCFQRMVFPRMESHVTQANCLEQEEYDAMFSEKKVNKKIPVELTHRKMTWNELLCRDKYGGLRKIPNVICEVLDQLIRQGPLPMDKANTMSSV